MAIGDGVVPGGSGTDSLKAELDPYWRFVMRGLVEMCRIDYCFQRREISGPSISL